MSTRTNVSDGAPSSADMPAEPEAARATPRDWITGWLQRVGRKVLSAVQHAGHFGILLVATLAALPQIRRYWPATVEHAKRIGVDGVALVIIVGGLSGSLLAQQTGYQLSGALPLSLVGSGVVAGMLTELGPVLTAIVIAGRTGAGIGAELGTMKVTDQIDALVTLGRDPVVELVAPRVVGGVIAMIPLVIIANFVGIFAGWFTAVSLLPMTTAEYVQGARSYYHSAALIFSLVKAPIFGFTITFVACYFGLRAEGGAAGVGRTATAAVVAIIVAIMVLDVILAPVYNAVA